MRVKIGDKIYNTDEEPILFIFEDDNELCHTVKNLSEMPFKEGIRKYLVYPDDKCTVEEAENFMKI